MKNLIQTLVESVNAKAEVTDFFIRDDDVGWAGDLLYKLTNRVFDLGVPIDFAIIPMALDSKSEKQLLDLKLQAPQLIGFHQHGYAHTNHQPQGRKCEFGEHRIKDQQRTDIMKGVNRLYAAFGDLPDSVFTPPWNRCNQNTVDVLLECGFEILSRDNTAQSLDTGSLQELPISIDWLKKRKGTRLSVPAFLEDSNSHIVQNQRIGIMLHHEMMDEADIDLFSAFVSALSACPKARFQSMTQLGGLA